MALSNKQAKHLRALGHALTAVVYVGGAGLSDGVVDKTDKELENHELVKVKVAGDRDAVKDAAARLSAATRSEVAQVIGKTILLYRRRKEKPEIQLPQD